MLTSDNVPQSPTLSSGCDHLSKPLQEDTVEGDHLKQLPLTTVPNRTVDLIALGTVWPLYMRY